jgi:hypothetical protein
MLHKGGKPGGQICRSVLLAKEHAEVQFQSEKQPHSDVTDTNS